MASAAEWFCKPSLGQYGFCNPPHCLCDSPHCSSAPLAAVSIIPLLSCCCGYSNTWSRPHEPGFFILTEPLLHRKKVHTYIYELRQHLHRLQEMRPSSSGIMSSRACLRQYQNLSSAAAPPLETRGGLEKCLEQMGLNHSTTL